VADNAPKMSAASFPPLALFSFFSLLPGIPSIRNRLVRLPGIFRTWLLYDLWWSGSWRWKKPKPITGFSSFTHDLWSQRIAVGGIGLLQLPMFGIIPPCKVSSPCNAFRTQSRCGLTLYRSRHQTQRWCTQVQTHKAGASKKTKWGGLTRWCDL